MAFHATGQEARCICRSSRNDRCRVSVQIRPMRSPELPSRGRTDMQAHLQRQRRLTMLKHRLTRLNIATIAACVGLTCSSAPAASLAAEVDHGLKTGIHTMPVNESAVRATAAPRDAAPIGGMRRRWLCSTASTWNRWGCRTRSGTASWPRRLRTTPTTGRTGDCSATRRPRGGPGSRASGRGTAPRRLGRHPAERWRTRTLTSLTRCLAGWIRRTTAVP